MDVTKFINPTVSAIKPSGIRKFFDLASSMEDVVSLSIGEPDFDTPWHIRDIGIYSLEKGRTHYLANAGLMELREEITRYMYRRFSLAYETNQVLVTVGGSEAIDLAFRVLLSPGDEVIIPEPCFVCYEPLCRLAGAIPVKLETKAEDEFMVTPEGLEQAITEKTRLLVLSYPNNPTGAIMPEAAVRKLGEIVKKHDLYVVSDEIYAELTYGGKHFSMAQIPELKDQILVVNGFSKAYAMTGWRLGFVCGHPEVVKMMTKLHQFGIMSASTTAQYAAVEALRNGDEDVAAMREEYDDRRHIIVDGLRAIGCPCFEPRGAFYVFPDVRAFNMTSEAFCEALLREEHVAIVPGNAFGAPGEGFARVSYASSLDNISKALERMERFTRKLRG
ncbi:MAG: aminotransferase class I/II-fold pyridoxal phosphate-dependent enzyme [Clostridia bacterium]|nr:aminotransferase class I/II-fold pyridoxal phosphate-dependent enzyme [Clostridia bacterium]MBQ6989878.1 aminotransferase class I/II-fold pyridoxal phosphate-dependent enzyme [Clostridia bacterium]